MSLRSWIYSICLLALLPVSVWGTEELPKKGLIAHWNFSKHLKRDLVRGRMLGNKEFLITGKLNSGKTYVNDQITLPFSISELDSFTVVLKYGLRNKTNHQDSIDGKVEPRYSIKGLDGKMVYFHMNPILCADDGTLELSGYTNDSIINSATYKIKASHDRNGEFALIASYKRIPQKVKSSDQHFLLGIGCNGEMKYYYAKSSYSDPWSWNAPKGEQDKITLYHAGNLARLTEIAIYHRTLNESELSQIMKVDKTTSIPPEIDTTTYKDWRLIIFAIIIILVLKEIFSKRDKNYGFITQQYIRNKYGERESYICRDEALMKIDKLWDEFGGNRKKPVYPSDIAHTRMLFEEALATGCTDRDVLKEYNRLAVLINTTVKVGLKSSAGISIAALLFIILSFLPLYNKEWLYVIHTNGFIVNWVCMATCFIACFGVKKGKPGKRIRGARLQMGLIGFCGGLFGGLLKSCGTVIATLIMTIVSIPFILLYIALSCVTEFAVVSVATGQVVATGVTGFGSGCLLSIIVVWLVGYILDSTWESIVWLLVFLAPIVSYWIAKLYDVD